MSKVKFEELKKGSVVESKKSGDKFQVIEILEGERKGELKNLTTDISVVLSASTLERWYKQTEEAVGEVKEVSTPTTSGPAVARPARKGRAVPKSKIEEDIEESEEVEEVGSISEKVPNTRKPAPKTESILAITKSLETAIQEMYPSAERVVTSSYVAYRAKKNFVEISETRKGVTLGLRTDIMSKEDKEKLFKVYPKRYGWALDGRFNVKTEADVDVALELIEQSYHSTL